MFVLHVLNKFEIYIFNKIIRHKLYIGNNNYSTLLAFLHPYNLILSIILIATK